MDTAQHALRQSLGVPDHPAGEGLSEEEFIQQLADVVDYWMQHRMEELMSLCYTLDVSEPLVAQALQPSAPEPANIGLARLLYDRQRQRLITRMTIKSPPVDDADAW